MPFSVQQLVRVILGGILFAELDREFAIFSSQMIAYYSVEQFLRNVLIFSIF